MPEVDQSDSNSNKTAQPNRNALSADYARFKFLPVGLRRIVVSALLLWLVVIGVSTFLPNLRERVKFFTESTLSLSVLLVGAVQAYIYQKQREAMDKQSSAIEGQLNAMLTQTEQFTETKELSIQQVKALGQQVDA